MTGNTKVQFVTAPVFFPSPALVTPRMALYACMQFINEEAITETIYSRSQVERQNQGLNSCLLIPNLHSSVNFSEES